MQKKQWCGQDNLHLPISEFFNPLGRWVDVGRHYHPVKDYVAALDRLVWHLKLPDGEYTRIFPVIRNLRNDLADLAARIDEIMEKGGAR